MASDSATTQSGGTAGLPSSVLTAPPIIHELVAKFAEHRETYKAEKYNETQLRRDFLDPFFAAMGWDIDNRKGYAEKFREVIHEDAIKVEASVKAPDYCFRIGGQRIFFVEAKKPAVNIKDDIAPAFQIRRYAWTAKMPLSILTDFEELAVYDCRIKPDQKDKASTGRVMLLKYTDYVEKWQELCEIFSYDAIARGAFDKYAESNKKKRGTAEVDEAFLAEIEEWRESIAKNLSLRNKELTDRELNTAVQLIIDRIIFLRMCEGRGIEPFGKLQGLLNGEKVYQRLVEQFHKADEKYNSGLFHFTHEKGREEPDALTTSLVVDDKVLKEIIRRLYYPDSPYEFAAMPAEILGQVYEQFLGKVIRLTKSHQAKIEEKPEVRKAGGVYYTPKYIVDYIVENTVGKLLEGKTPQDVGGLTATYQPSKTGRPLTVLDPACGSGSFLIVAYQYLLDWYLKQYTETDKPEKHAKGANPRIYLRKENDWRLTTGERKRILLSHIFGVDIDYQAVEVTKLSLLLKVLEGETEETLQRQLFAKERALPDLANNIKCGNSLIGPDFYIGRQTELFDEEETLRINAFDWQAEFKEIFSGKNAGFDAVIGNPPYVRQESLKQFKDYFEQHYKSFSSSADLFIFFIEKAINLLCFEGQFGFIVSSSLLRASYGERLREFLSQNAPPHHIVDFGGLAVFANAKDTYVCIPLMRKSSAVSSVKVEKVKWLPTTSLKEDGIVRQYTIPQDRLRHKAWSLNPEPEARLFRKVLSAGIPLGKVVERKIFTGLKTGYNQAFELSQQQQSDFLQECSTCAEIVKPFVGGLEVRRYYIDSDDRYLITIPSGWTRNKLLSSETQHKRISENEAWEWLATEFSPVAAHLAQYEKACRARQDKGEFWWELRSCAYYDFLGAPKIIYPDIAKEPRFYLDHSGVFLGNTAYLLGSKDPFLLGVLNSKLAWFAISNISIPFGVRAGRFRYRMIYQYMEHVPILIPKSAEQSRLKIAASIATSANSMQSMMKMKGTKQTAHERTTLERQIAATDREIDQLVYELYGLTDKEIALVEEATAEK